MQQRWEGAGPVDVWAGPVGSELAGSRPGVWERAATAAPGDGGRLLERGAPAPSCPRRRGWKTEENRICEREPEPLETLPQLHPHLPQLLLLLPSQLVLGFQLPLSLLFLSGGTSELLKAVAGGAHGGGRRGLGPLGQAGPGAHVLQLHVLEGETEP